MIGRSSPRSGLLVRINPIGRKPEGGATPASPTVRNLGGRVFYGYLPRFSIYAIVLGPARGTGPGAGGRRLASYHAVWALVSARLFARARRIFIDSVRPRATASLPRRGAPAETRPSDASTRLLPEFGTRR